MALADFASISRSGRIVAAHEADRRQRELRRAGVEPFGGVINASLTAGVTTHPAQRARAGSGLTHVACVEELGANRTWRLAAPRADRHPRAQTTWRAKARSVLHGSV